MSVRGDRLLGAPELFTKIAPGLYMTIVLLNPFVHAPCRFANVY